MNQNIQRKHAKTACINPEFVIPSASEESRFARTSIIGGFLAALGMTRVKPARRSINGQTASALFARISCGRLGARHDDGGSVGTEPVCLQAVSGSGPDVRLLQFIPHQPDLD